MYCFPSQFIVGSRDYSCSFIHLFSYFLLHSMPPLSRSVSNFVHFLLAVVDSCSLNVHFEEVMTPDTFRGRFSVLKPQVRLILELVKKVDILRLRAFTKWWRAKQRIASSLCRNRCIPEILARHWEKSGLSDLQKVPRVSFSVNIYGHKYQLVHQYFFRSPSAKGSAQSRFPMLGCRRSRYQGRLQKDRSVYGQW